jgi:hypothetical protein
MTTDARGQTCAFVDGNDERFFATKGRVVVGLVLVVTPEEWMERQLEAGPPSAQDVRLMIASFLFHHRMTDSPSSESSGGSSSAA